MIGLCGAVAFGRIMTRQRIYRLRTKIEEARANLLKSNPFYALMLMYLKFVAVSNVKTISTDGVAIYFSPDFLEKLYPDELEYILCHQILHIIFGDVWCAQNSDNKDYHLACDEFVNYELRESGFLDKRYAHLGDFRKSFLLGIADTSSLTRNDLYNSMCFSLELFDERIQRSYLPDSSICWGSNLKTVNNTLILDIYKNDPFVKMHRSDSVSKDDGGNGDGDNKNSSKDNFGGSGTVLQQLWSDRTQTICNIIEKFGLGIDSIPRNIERGIVESTEKAVNWKKLLTEFVQEVVSDYSFSPPDRRYSDTDFFLPDFNEKSCEIKNVLFMIDTSGSIKGKDLGRIYSEINSAIEMFNGKLSGYIGFFDTDVGKVEPFSDTCSIINITPVGGGGTSFYCIFDYINEKMQDNLPSCVIIFTDGMGACPSKPPVNIPVLWIVNSKETLPFGKVVRYFHKSY